MSNHVRRIEAVGIHGRFDVEQTFDEGVNIIFGENGTGKTTLLHILANAINGDYERFRFLNFERIRIEFDEGPDLSIRLVKRELRDHYHAHVEINGEQATNDFCGRSLRPRSDRYRNAISQRDGRTNDPSPQRDLFKSALAVAYFPAFRTAIDAWAARQEDPRVRQRVAVGETQPQKTEFARGLFGAFVPRLDYPATSEIEWTLSEQIRSAMAEVSRADRKYFGAVPSRVLEKFATSESIDEDPWQILEEIKGLSARFQQYPIHVESTWQELYRSVRSIPKNAESTRVAAAVLTVFRDALAEIIRVQEQSFSKVDRYLRSVNSFLKGKSIAIGPAADRPRQTSNVRMEFTGNRARSVELQGALSSGERQIVTLIYATTQMSQQEVILVDEPEISLHVDWQRKLLPAMIEQMPSKQLIVCTHSPIVGTAYRARMKELNPRPTASSNSGSEQDNLLACEDQTNG